ncbi:hypothetical protein Gohar_026906 [Gossypium harknessii]|uniref:Uncharacterized protein n=1 Tax=Gossypium harknessii TaxID=34285 RepID=A0A7J9HT66_9ROSI|nr:hypothetical protein [Gossypium harknessii]
MKPFMLLLRLTERQAS